MPPDDATEQLFMDLPDFIPEEYAWGFSIKGTEYRFRYGEATVDEVLRLIWQAQEQNKDTLEVQRQTVVAFLTKYCVEGDPVQLAADLATVPFASKRGGLDIVTLFERINGRVKKNEPGANPTPEAASKPSGSAGNAPS